MPMQAMTYPHCRHCCWTHPAHVEIHHNACGCDECPYDYRPQTDLPSNALALALEIR